MTPQTGGALPGGALPGGALGPPALSLGAVGWARQHLFNTWGNALLTLAALWVIWRFLAALVPWAVLDASFGAGPESCAHTTGACWSFVREMWPLFLVGTYPADERWRPALALALIAGLGLVGLHRPLRKSGYYGWAWVACVVAVAVLIRGAAWLGLPEVNTQRWGGLLLTLLLTVVGLAVAFPFGVVLALGRRSRLPVIRALCVTYIELIRGVPLVTLLFMAAVMLPLFLPQGMNLDNVLKAQVGIILFSAAYLAEVVRGGLQGVTRGQEEAADALGLGYWQTMGLVVLPQALRYVIPPLVSTFIALLKDTTLVSIVGLFDLLGMAQQAIGNPRWLGRGIETYVFSGVIYLVLCYSMSRYSRYLEARFTVRR